MAQSNIAQRVASAPTANAAAQGGDPLVFTCSRPEQPWLRRTLIKGAERLAGRARLARMYRHWVATRESGEATFSGETLFAAGCGC